MRMMFWRVRAGLNASGGLPPSVYTGLNIFVEHFVGHITSNVTDPLKAWRDKVISFGLWIWRLWFTWSFWWFCWNGQIWWIWWTCESGGNGENLLNLANLAKISYLNSLNFQKYVDSFWHFVFVFVVFNTFIFNHCIFRSENCTPIKYVNFATKSFLQQNSKNILHLYLYFLNKPNLKQPLPRSLWEKVETLPEAQRTQGIASKTWVISPAKLNATCIG